jgi:hypothetical protein
VADWTLIDIPDEYDRKRYPHNRQDKHIVPGILSLETILQRFSYKMDQVFNDNSGKSCSQANKHGQEVEEPMTA